MENPNNEVIRAISMYNPFATLMLHGKIETRTYPTKVRGKVVIAACILPYPFSKIWEICGPVQYERIMRRLAKKSNTSYTNNGMFVCIGDLVDCRPMTKEDEDKCFVQYREPWMVTNKKTGKEETKQLWCWVFENIERLEPMPYTGSQGWSILSPGIVEKLQIQSRF